MASRFLTNVVHDDTVLSNRELEAILSKYGISIHIFRSAMLTDPDLLEEIFKLCEFTFNK